MNGKYDVGYQKAWYNIPFTSDKSDVGVQKSLVFPVTNRKYEVGYKKAS